MKQTTKFLKLFCVLALFLSAKTIMAQCSVSFNYAVNPGGVVNFSASTNFAPNQVYWNFGNGYTNSSLSPTLNLTPSTTYSASGIYTISLMATNGCSATAIQTINITVSSGTVCNLVAGFNAQVGNNGNVYFGNTTTGTVTGFTSYTLDYGDGTTDYPSGAGNWGANHTYPANGVYMAMLTANVSMTPACTSTAVSTFTVNTLCSSPLSTTLTSTQSAGNVTLAALSTGTLSGASYQWSIYGMNGPVINTITSTSEFVTTFSLNGSYGVGVTVTNPMPTACSAGDSYTVTINSSTVCVLDANISSYQSPGSAVQFYDASTGVNAGATYAWDFGDGSAISTLASPAHTYSTDGTYTVSLTVDNNLSPACVSTQTVAFVVNSGCYLAADFTYTVGSNGLVSFVNGSAGTNTTTTYSWSFGDGGSSSLEYPTHTYYNGTYTVTFYVTNPYPTGCMDSISKVITVSTNTCIANSNFSMTPSGTPQYWYAVPASSVGVTAATWSWGDGASTNGLFSSHTYSAAGSYYICLSVTVACGASSTSCYTAAISKSSQNNSIIQVEAIDATDIATGIKTSGVKTIAYSVSPNPSNGLVNVNISGLTSAKAKISVYNLVGKLVYESENETSNGTLVKDVNLDNISNGVYFMKVSSDNKTHTKKIVINK